MCPLRYISFCLMALLAFPFCSCRPGGSAAKSDGEVLVQVGDSTLLLSDVLLKIPVGLSPEDSAALFNSIVGDWVRDLVLSDYAEKNIPDLARIDRMTEAYRNNLIVNEYLRNMSDRVGGDVSESRIRDYYAAHKSEMVLEQPLVKGALIKVADTDESLADIRKWMGRFADEDVDRIEKSGLRRATQYNYFNDQWHEWSVVADQIPYRFFDADAFVRSTQNFETSDNGTVYLLHISDFMPSGEEMPYEFARLRISEILHSADVAAYRKRLMDDIYREQIGAGVLKPGLYDPVKGTMAASGAAKENIKKKQ